MPFVLRSAATIEPLTPRWLDAHRTRFDPQLTPLQRIASEAIWAWFDERSVDRSVFFRR